MALLERLAILITADAAGAVGEMKKLASEADKNFGSVEGKASSFAGSMTKVGAGMMAAGAGVMAVGIASANSTVELGREVMKLQRLTGMNAEAASGLRGAAKLAGTDVDALAIGLVKLSKAAETNSPKFDDLGIKTRDAAGALIPMADLLPIVADKFQEMPNGIEKTVAATTLFGKSGADLIPFLNRGAAGLQELTDKAKEMGITLSEGNVGQIKTYITAQRELEQSIDGIKTQVGMEMIPVMTFFTDMFKDLPGPIQDAVGPLVVFGGAALTAAGTIATVIGTIIQVAPSIDGMIEGMVGAAQGMASMIIAGGPLVWTIVAVAAAIAIAAAAFAIFSTGSTVNTAAVKSFTEAMELGGAAAERAVDALIIKGFAEDKTADALRKSGVEQKLLNDVIDEGGIALKTYVESVRHSGESAFVTSHFYDQLSDSQKAYVDQLKAAKTNGDITLDEFQKLISSLGDLAQEHGDAKTATEQTGIATEIMTPKVSSLAAAEAAAAAATDKHREAADELNKFLHGAIDPYLNLITAGNKNAEAQQKAADAANETVTAYLNLLAAQASGDPAKIAEATETLTAKQNAYNKSQRDAVDSAIDYQTALNTLKLEVESGDVPLSQAIAKVDELEAHHRISGTTAEYWRNMLSQAAAAAGDLNGMNVVVPMSAPGLEIALGNLRTFMGIAKGEIQGYVTADQLAAYNYGHPSAPAGPIISPFDGKEYVKGFDQKLYPKGNASGGRLPGFAAGGRPSSPSLVGELGPEIFWPDSAGTIIAADRSRQMLGAGSGGGTNVTNVSITVTSMNPDDVIRAIRKYERSNGKQWATA